MSSTRLPPFARTTKVREIQDLLKLRLCRVLDHASPLGLNWEGVAGEIQRRCGSAMYPTLNLESFKNAYKRIEGSPSRELLTDYGSRTDYTLSDLYDILATIEHREACSIMENYFEGVDSDQLLAERTININIKQTCLELPPHGVIPRTKEIKSISEKFQELKMASSASSPVVRSVYISGPPNCGKTELARQYQEHWVKERKEEYNGTGSQTVVASFLKLSSAEKFTESLKSLVHQLNPHAFDMIKEDHHLLEHIHFELSRVQWLLVLDDLNYEFNWPVYLPDGRSRNWGSGEVLVTTSDRRLIPKTPSSSELCLTSDWTENDAVKLLRLIRGKATLDDDDSVFLGQISSILNYHPMSLAVAASYVKDSEMSWQEYLQLLHEGGQLDIEEEMSSLNWPSPVRVTQITLNQMLLREQTKRTDGVFRAALQLFSVCSFHPIPFSVFKQHFKTLGIRPTSLDVAYLKKCSLFNYSENPGAVAVLSVNRTTHQAIIQTADNSEDDCLAELHSVAQDASQLSHRADVLRSLVDSYNEADDWDDDDRSTSLKVCLLPHVIRVTESIRPEDLATCDLSVKRKRVVAEGFMVSADALDNLGRPVRDDHQTVATQQKEYLEKSLALFEEVEDGRQIAKVNLELAKVYDDLFNLPKAVEFGMKALSGARQYSDNQFLLPLCLHTVGRFYLDVSQLAKARALLEEGLQASKATFGPKSLQVASILTLLGRTHHDLGEADRGKKLLERSLTICDEEGRSPSKANTYVLAQTLVALGRACLEPKFVNANAAIELLSRALDIRVRLHSYEHPMTALTLTSLARGYLVSQRPLVARPRLEEALRIQEQVLPADHLDKAITLNILGNVERTLENWERAVDLLRRSLEIRETSRGPDHPEVCFVATDLGVALLRMGEPTQALVYLQRGLEIKKSRFGENHIEIAIGYSCLQDAHQALGNVAEAAECLRRYEDIMRMQDDRRLDSFRQSQL